jgi:hypothetical protein
VPSGKGFQLSLRGLLGVAASGVEGLEVNILSLNFGVGPSGIKLPLVGRIGAPRIPAVIAAYERFLELNTDLRRERIADAKLRRMPTKLKETRRTEPVKATGVM